MTPDERESNIRDGIERARSFRSAGHWDASTNNLAAAWHSAQRKLIEARTPELVFLASVSRELNAIVLRDRNVEGPWNTPKERKETRPRGVIRRKTNG